MEEFEKKKTGTTLKYIKESGMEITIKIPENATIGDMCDAFGDFLRASGYIFDGSIELVESETSSFEEEEGLILPKSRAENEYLKQQVRELIMEIKDD